MRRPMPGISRLRWRVAKSSCAGRCDPMRRNRRQRIPPAGRRQVSLRLITCSSFCDQTCLAIGRGDFMALSIRDNLSSIVQEPVGPMVRNDVGHSGFTLTIDGKTVQAYKGQTLAVQEIKANPNDHYMFLMRNCLEK